MHKPAHVLEIFLQPGELYFGDRNTRIRTVLGSCVSMVFWHPGLLVGGMSHYMLPRAEGVLPGRPLDGRYADEAMALMLREIDGAGAPRREYHVKVFGGGDMFSQSPKAGSSHVGLRNVEAARCLMASHGFACVAEHLGGTGHRNVIFDIWSGHVWMKHQPQESSVEMGRPRTLVPSTSVYGRLPCVVGAREGGPVPCSR